MQVFHIAGRSDWNAAQRSGRYFSPGFDDRGRLDAHLSCARAGQWDDVRKRVYADALMPLVLLEIDTDRLASPFEETGSSVRVLGPLNTDAVVGVRDLPRASADEIAVSLARSTARDFGTVSLVWGFLVTVFAICVFGLGALGHTLDGDTGSLVGGGLGLALASALTAAWLLRRAAD